MKKAFVLMIALIFPLMVNAEIRLQDNFEYAVDRTTENSADAFVSTGPWNGVKSINSSMRRGCGYIYTVTSIPGFNGRFPGANSNRVLCMEFLPATMNCDVGDGWLQTDCYLSFGSEASPENNIPSDVWIQFWIYLQRYGNQISRFNDGKWLYPSKTGSYPAQSMTGLDWLVVFSENSHLPYWETAPPGSSYWTNIASNANYAPEPDNAWKLGHNMAPNTGRIPLNTWTLVKMHLDTRGPQGVWEQWHKTIGGSFVKVMEWRGNVTPNFTWTISNANGHKALRLGTTINDYDSWIYLDDFVIATSEADLPTYSSQGPPFPQPPQNLRIIQ